MSMKIDTVDFPTGGVADHQALEDAHGGEQGLRDAANRDRRSPNYRAFLEWGKMLAAELEADPECDNEAMAIELVAAFALGYRWRQIIEHRRVAESN